jgi:hypothetical protein
MKRLKIAGEGLFQIDGRDVSAVPVGDPMLVNYQWDGFTDRMNVINNVVGRLCLGKDDYAFTLGDSIIVEGIGKIRWYACAVQFYKIN